MLSSLPLVLAITFAGWWLQYRGGYSWGWDEANILLSAREIARGVRLYDPMWWNYPPVFLWGIAAVLTVTETPVLTARAVTLLLASLGLLVTAGLAQRISGAGAAVVTVLLLAFAPGFVENARTVVADVPTVTLALLAIWMLLRAREGQTYAWVAGGTFIFTVAVFSKFTALPLAPATGLALLLAGPRSTWYKRAGIALVTCIGTTALILSQLPVPAFLDQAVVFHVTVGDRSVQPLENAIEVGRFLSRPREIVFAPSLLLALLSLPPLINEWRQRSALLTIWVATGGALATVLLYTPLYSHHIVLLMLPVAVLAGVGVMWGLDRIAERRPARRQALTDLATGTVVFLLLVAFFRPDHTYSTPNMPEEDNKAEDARLLAAELRKEMPAGTTILSDDPMIPLMSGHSPPPTTVNVSERRFIHDGEKTIEPFVSLLEETPPDLIVFWTDRFLELPGFLSWVQEHYVPTRVYDDKQRAYERRPALPFRQTAAFDDHLTLHAYDLEPVAVEPGGMVTLTLSFALGPAVNEETTFFVHVGDGEQRLAGIDERIRNSDVELEDWLTGDRIRRTIPIQIPPDAKAGWSPIRVGAYHNAPDQPLGNVLLTRPLFVGNADQVFASPEPSHESDAEWPALARLLDADVTHVDGELQVRLYWQARVRNAPNATVFVQVLDHANSVIAQSDAFPDAGRRPTPGWVPGEVIVDTHRLTLPADTSAGTYVVVAGLYDPTTGQRFPAHTASDPLPTDAVQLSSVELP